MNLVRKFRIYCFIYPVRNFWRCNLTQGLLLRQVVYSKYVVVEAAGFLTGFKKTEVE